MGSRLGVLLRHHRTAAHMTQEALAERSGLSVKAISALERGVRRFPQQPTIGVLADALGLDDAQRTALIDAASRVQRTEIPPHLALPRQLPPDIAKFTGRADEVITLIRLLTERRTPVVAITGMGGAGKTAVALHVAHAVADRYPGGQLYVDLQGYAQDPPLSEAQALRHLLASLGADTKIDDLDAAAHRYRSAITDQRVLVVLDNAVDAAHVHRLLPDRSGTAAIVTSRRATADIPQTRIGTLTEDEALALLASLAGEKLIRAERVAAAEIVRQCGLLPSAIRVAGARLAARPGWTVQHLAERLRDDHRRLGDLQIDGYRVATQLNVSIERLVASEDATDVEAADALHKLAASKQQRIDAEAAARLLDLTQSAAERLLERLVDTSLLTAHGANYRLHELVRILVRERATRSSATRTDPQA